MEEFRYRCPYCYALISTLIEPSSGHFDYEEDCEICCRSIRLRFRVKISEGGEIRVLSFRATTSDDL
ncbi:MAG: CPXCG motif-containing cysteine-rich protein [Thermaurantimonas sp.]